MKYLNITNFAILFAYIIVMTSCGGSGSKSGHHHADEHKHHVEKKEHHGHHHADEIPDLSFTIFTDDYELFVEFPALVVGEKSRLLAHFTQLSTYKPVRSAVVKAYTENDKSNVASVNKPLRDGIFTPTYIPKKAGKTSFVVTLSVDGKNLSFVIKNINVYKNEHDASHLIVEDHDGITYLKETSWFTEFAIEKVQKKEFDEIIKCSGKIISDSKDEISVVAPTAGVFTYFDRNIIPGKRVKKGQVIGAISGGVIEDDIKNRFSKAKASFEEAEENYIRAKKLVDDKIISKKQFAATKAQYIKAKSDYNLISKNYSKSGRLVYAPVSGIVSELMVMGNGSVKGGNNILVIRKDLNYMLRADLPKSYINSFNNIYDANFKMEYSDKVFSISELGGERIKSAYTGKMGTAFIPVYFNLPKEEQLITGSFAEVFLKSNNRKNVLTVPVDALMESNGNYYLYVQITGELFEERYVTPGRKDGYRVEILKGLEEGEYVITKGTYKVKQASMSNAVPTHTH